MTPFYSHLLSVRKALIATFCAFCATTTSMATDMGDLKPGSPIDVVFVVDVSGSTGGILSAVRSKFWEIQNEVSRLEPAPAYRIGIVCMGRPSFKKENNYVQIISDLTDDIDAAAYPFFQIKDVTAPGNYFMGHALDVAVNQLSWSTDPNAVKMMFLVGNGKPSAGPGYRKPVNEAKERGIIINSLYFLTYSNPTEQSEWKTIASETGGGFFVIGLKEPAIVLEKPYDGTMLREASRMLNKTYVYYGVNGLTRYEMQADLDEESELIGENSVEARTFFKSSSLYVGKNYKWDLIDLASSGKGVPTKENRKYMDEAYATMSAAELTLALTEISYERKEYLSIIKMLSTKREAFLGEMKEKMKNYRFGNTFFGVVNRTIAETAEKHGYKLEY